MYKLNKDWQGIECSVTRISDNTSIPMNPDNTDFVEYQKWLDAGNTPLPADEVTE